MAIVTRRRPERKQEKRAALDEQAAKERIKEPREKFEAAIREVAGLQPIWQQAMAFFGNDQYTFIHAVTGELDRMETREGGAKASWRNRLQSNRMTSNIVAEASILTARTPGYEVTAPNQDPARKNQARMGERALLAEHQRLDLGSVGMQTLLHAINTGAGFTFPFWDSTYGSWLGDVEGADLYEGDIRTWVLHNGEVFWEPGLPFEESSWVGIRKARAISSVEQEDGFLGGKLVPDAKTGLWERPGNDRGELVFVHHYFHVPCKAYPKGAWIRYANDREIFERADYPRASGGPVLHKVPWIPQPGKHRDLGAGEQLVDVQRMINRIVNQIIAWRNLILRPQMTAPKGAIEEEPTEEDGVIYEYNPMGGQKPEFREVPEVPQSLYQDLERCYEQMDHILGMRDLPAGVEAAAAFEAVNDREQSARGLFIRGLASYWASLGHHMLELIHENFNEPRLLEIQGRRGVELIEDFTGNKIGRPGTVRVSEASIEPRTKQAMEARVMMYAERGWISGHQAMAAISGGTAEALIDDYELDVQRQYREIDALEALETWTPDEEFVRAQELWVANGNDPEQMPDELWSLPPVPFASEQDNHVVHMDVLKQWMKTREFELLPQLAQDAARNHLQQHDQMMKQTAMDSALEQQNMAAQLGMGNAAKPQTPTQPGDQAAYTGTKTRMAGGATR